MKLTLMIFGLILLLLISIEAKLLSYGSTNAREGQFPFAALLSYRGVKACGASIFHERWAITAAHCLKHRKGKPLEPMLTVGTIASVGTGESYSIDKFYAHPDFIAIPADENNGLEYVANDIGLIRLKSNISFNDKVKPITLATDEKNSFENTTATMAGWGRYVLEIRQNHLHYINVRVISPDECRKVWTYIDKHICTSTQEKKGACYGDSGSPLVVDGKQIGIVSTGEATCKPLQPDLYTKVASFIPWIKDVLKEHGDVLPDS